MRALWLAALFLMWPAPAATAGWVDGRTCGPFLVRADFVLDGFEGLLEDLSGLQQDLTGALAVPAAQEPIEVYLFADRATYAEYLKRYLPHIPYRRALYVKAKGPGMVFAYRSPQFERDLRHECTHALLHASLPVVPLWLDEGLAAYFELPRKQRAYDHPHLATLRWTLRLGLGPGLETLEKKAKLSEMGQAEYRQAWAWVHFMLHGPPEVRQELSAYLGELRGRGVPTALSARLKRRLADPAAEMATHVKGWKRG